MKTIILLLALILNISCSKKEISKTSNVIKEDFVRKNDELIEPDLKSYNPFIGKLNIGSKL